VSSAQKPSLNYPSAQRADVIDNYFGTKVADPHGINRLRLATQVFTSWNHLDGWLRQVEGLRRVA
jgi:hypothetical protein